MKYVIALHCFEIHNIFEKMIYGSQWSKFVMENDEYNESVVNIFIKNIPNDLSLYHSKFPFYVSNILMNGKNILVSDKYWKKIFIYNRDSYEIFQNNLMYIFNAHAVQRHMIQLHSSLIATTDNRGLMFLGPSGIGKTTQAELWHKYRDALIINGDIVFVQETEDAFLGWGTPWHGSSPYCENTNVPVEALVVLKQAPENSIRELTGFEKVSEVSNSVFYPRWLENGMELCLETLDHLLSKLPVYELRCRPDEDAVRLTEETIFKN